MKNIGPKALNYGIWVLILMLSLTLVKNVNRAGEIKKQIQAEKDKIAKIEADNNKLSTELARAQSPEFIEREVRDKLGLGMAGEVMVVLPDGEILRKFAPVIKTEVDTLPDPNWRKWMKLFF